MANNIPTLTTPILPFNSSMTSKDDSGKEPHILLAVIMLVTMIVAFVGNILVILVIVNTRKLHTITCGFLLNLAFSDLCAGVFLLPFAIGSALHRGYVFQNIFLCQFLGMLYIGLCFISTWTLTGISIERYIAINNPLHYHSIVTKNKAWIAMTSTWVLALVIATIPFHRRQAYVYLENYAFCLLNFEDYPVIAVVLPSIEICIPFCIMCYTYISIGHVACTQARKKIIQCNEEHCVFVSPKKKDYRAAKILALMAGVFTFCWFPFTMLSLIQAINPQHGTFPDYVTLISLWLTLLSSAINPWLYSILNTTFRTAMHKSALQLFKKVTCASDFNFTDGESRTWVRNSHSRDNTLDVKPVEGTLSRQQTNKIDAIKLEPLEEVKESPQRRPSEAISVPGQVETHSPIPSPSPSPSPSRSSQEA